MALAGMEAKCGRNAAWCAHKWDRGRTAVPTIIPSTTTSPRDGDQICACGPKCLTVQRALFNGP